MTNQAHNLDKSIKYRIIAPYFIKPFALGSSGSQNALWTVVLFHNFEETRNRAQAGERENMTQWVFKRITQDDTGKFSADTDLYFVRNPSYAVNIVAYILIFTYRVSIPSCLEIIRLLFKLNYSGQFRSPMANLHQKVNHLNENLSGPQNHHIK